MDALLSAILSLSGINDLAQNNNVARQGVINHQGAMHLATLSFVRDATEMSSSDGDGDRRRAER